VAWRFSARFSPISLTLRPAARLRSRASSDAAWPSREELRDLLRDRARAGAVRAFAALAALAALRSLAALRALTSALAAQELAGPAGCLAHGVPDAADELVEVPDRLAGRPTSPDRLPGALAEPLDTLLGALAQTLDALLRALADLRDGAARALSSASQRVAGIGQQVARPATHSAECLTEAREQLRVAVERGEHPLEDRRDVCQARLQEHLRPDALDVELDLAKADASSMS